MYSGSNSDSGEAQAILKTLQQQSTAIKMIQQFRGILLDQEVSILDVCPDSAVFQATNLKMCAVLEGLAYLRNRKFPRPLAGRVVDMSVRRGMIILSEFAFAETEWKERRQERVCQKNPTYVSLRCKRRVFRVPLENISVNGMGVLAYKIFERGATLEPGSMVRLDFRLSSGYNWADIRGKIIHLQSIDNSMARIGIRLYPNEKEARSLARYVALRKREIMEEMNRAYMKRIEPRTVDCLFF
jgi:hypothetical protein